MAVVLPMEWQAENGVHNATVVIDEHGAIQGWQIKNQLDPAEDHLYVPGNVRSVFTIKGVTFAIAICHEGWRNYAMPYQESPTSLISPEGECLSWAPYGEELLLVHDIDPARATRLLAQRYNSDRYGEAGTPPGA